MDRDGVEEWHGRPEARAGVALSAANAHAMLCGNPGMVAAAEVALLAHGVAPADIHAERYWTASGPTA